MENLIDLLSGGQQQKRNERLNQIKRQLTRDPGAYIESVGKVDADNLVDIVDRPDEGTTAIRLIMGATAFMPFRALSYVDSALRIARMIPATQIQIVHANHLGQKVNGIKLGTSNHQAQVLSKHVQYLLRKFPDLDDRVLHAQDTPLDTDQYTPIVETAFERDPELAEKLLRKGEDHGGDAVRYVAAHYAFQDTDSLVLDSLTPNGPDQIAVDTIVSIGCNQERNFYRARMGMQALAPTEIRTAQLFTRHVVPPYYEARGGESLLEVGHWNPVMIADPTVVRDIEHFTNVNPEYGEY